LDFKPNNQPLWVGVDVGGTFTDAVICDKRTGELRWAKAPSVPADPAQGVLTALRLLVSDAGQVERFVHGITIGTNSVIERKGAEVWVVTTEGFRDTLEIARTERRELYNIKALKPASLVPRGRILEAHERIRFDGTVETSLGEDSCDAIAANLAEQSAVSVAVCFLHSYANDSHEEAMASAIRKVLPDAFVSLSSEVLPELREYERFSTTVLNAYIGPLMSGYLDSLQRELAQEGYRRTIFLMTSNGGVASAHQASRFPVNTVLSGPAGGVAASINLGQGIGVRQLITCDMGGTSTDVCLIDDLRAPLTSDQAVAGFPNRTPQMEIVTIGAGGGSIAWRDSGNILAVGPRSAGADPGPAAYGLGGTEPTVTDANLVLNRLHADTPLASNLHLDSSAAAKAIEALAGHLESEDGLRLDTMVLAEGIVRIAVARMVSAIKEISISKGFDPRDFALLAYGGAGPMHGAFVAEELDIHHVVVPPSPGNFSAFGCLVSDLQRSYVKTHLAHTRTDDWPQIERVFEELEASGRAALEAEDIGWENMSFHRELGMRYVGQSWELLVDLGDGDQSMPAAESAFQRAHERRYGHAAEAPAQIVSVRLTVTGRVPKPSFALDAVVGSDQQKSVQQRRVGFGNAVVETPVLDRIQLSLNEPMTGPLLIEEMGALTVVPPRWTVSLGQLGELNLRRIKERQDE